MKKSFTWYVFILIVPILAFAQPQVPTSINYQGMLMDDAGDPITAGALPTEFKIYDALTNGTLLWEDNFNLEIDEGLFSVILGPIPDTVFTGTTGTERSLEIAPYYFPDGYEPMAPRQKIVSVAYAMRAAIADSVVNGPNGGVESVGVDAPLEDIGTASNPHLKLNYAGGLYLDVDTLKVSIGENEIQDNAVTLQKIAPTIIGTVDGVNPDVDGGDIDLVEGTNITITHPGGNAIEIAAEFDPGPIDHGTLTGLEDDDHPQYFLQNGSENFEGSIIPSVNNSFDIGSGSRFWSNAYCNNIRLYGSIYGNPWCDIWDVENIMPYEDESGNLGASNYRFEHAFIVNLHQGSLLQDTPIPEPVSEFDVVVMDGSRGQLVTSTQAGDRRVFGVAKYTEEKTIGKGDRARTVPAAFYPVTHGICHIKVIGPVSDGDFLVSSSTPGYAIASSDPKIGTVIAQALEDFNGKSGTVKAMIRKF